MSASELLALLLIAAVIAAGALMLTSKTGPQGCNSSANTISGLCAPVAS